MTTRLANSSSLEQRGVIRFLLAESVKSCEILSRMQRQYGPSCMSRANFYKWVQAFKDGRESITDDLKSGRPVDVSTPEAVQADNTTGIFFSSDLLSMGIRRSHYA